MGSNVIQNLIKTEKDFETLETNQIMRQLNSFLFTAQLCHQGGTKMSMAADTMMGVREGALPNPATASTLPFALVYTLIVLNELHLVLNHEIDGLPSILPNALSNF